MALATTPIVGHKALVTFEGASGIQKSQPILSESLVHVQESIESQGIVGTRTLEEKKGVAGPTHNSGSLEFEPNRKQLEQWLSFIMGASQVAAATIANDGDSQITDINNLTGVVPEVNMTSGVLYVKVVSAGASSVIELYKEVGLSTLVGHTDSLSASDATAAITADSNSGLGGSINVAKPGGGFVIDVDITATITSITYKLAEALMTGLDVQVYKSIGGENFTEGTVTSAAISSATAGIIKLALNMLFESWADASSTYSEDLDAGLPYPHSGLVLTVDSVAHRCEEMTVNVDHMVADDHRNNSVDLQELSTGGREITLDIVLPYTAANEILVAKTRAATAGELTHYAATAVWTAPDSHTVTFTMGKLRLETEEKQVGSREGELKLHLTGRAHGTTTRNDELTITVTDA